MNFEFEFIDTDNLKDYRFGDRILCSVVGEIPSNDSLKLIIHCYPKNITEAR